MDWRALTQVKEMGVTVFSCPPLAQDLAKVFEVYWYLGQDSAEFPTSWPDYLSTTINVDNPLPVKLGGDQSFASISSSPKQFNPNGRTNDIDAILSVITSAKKFIYIAVMDYFPIFLYSRPTQFWPVIDNALREAAIVRGIEVRVMGSHWNHTRKSMFNFLKSLDSFYNFDKRGGNIAAKLFQVPADENQAKIPFARVNHNKYMVTDEVAYIGTSNWSADYFTNTGGVAFIAREKNNTCYQTLSLRQKLVNVFERDWDSTYAHYLDDFADNKLRTNMV
jgi:phospholipase D3/4